MRIGRRGLLKGLGAGAALALPFARALSGRADERGRPIRFVAIITPSGTIREAWGTRRSEADFDLGPILEPFAALRDRMLVIEGLDMSAARDGIGGGHQKGPGAILTGQPLLEGDFCGGMGCFNGRSGWAAGPSIDQAIADSLDGATRLRSLELGVRVLGANNRHRISFRGANDPVPPDGDPFSVYERLFAGAGLDRAQLERQRRERASVLDLVQADLAELEGRLGSEHRQRLDAHLESIRELERQLDATLASGACAAPELAARFDPHASASYPLVSRLQLDLLTTALACDATRVATVFYSGGNSFQSFPWIGVPDQHHALSHEGDGNRDAQRKLTRIDTWYATEIARFAARLAATPDGDGTLLDSTIVFWGNELSKGNTHSVEDMLFLVLGGRRAGVRADRWLRSRRRPHNDLLVSFARGMGLDIERFGHREHGTGPLTETGIG